MGKILNVAATVLVVVQILILSTTSPVLAISADLAKKCRDMAIKAHPPASSGTQAYAQAERDFFKACIANNGQMDGANPQGDAPSPQR